MSGFTDSSDGAHPDGAAELGPTPVSAALIFGDRAGLAAEFAQLLAQEGVRRGLIGPREVSRLWDRHLLNCAVVADLVAPDSTVIDVGSGAGLPGLPLAIARPDVRLVLVEPMLRRVTWLNEAVGELGLDNVEVIRGRAEAQWGVLRAPAVTARAVAPLDRLAAWCLPLVAAGGELLAMKGERGAEELATADLPDGVTGTVQVCGEGVVPEPTTVVRLRVSRALDTGTPIDAKGRGGKSAARPRKVTRPGRERPTKRRSDRG